MDFILNLIAIILSIVGTFLNLWGGWGLWKRLDPKDYEGKPVLFATSTVPTYMKDQGRYLGLSVVGTTFLLSSTVILLVAQVVG